MAMIPVSGQGLSGLGQVSALGAGLLGSLSTAVTGTPLPSTDPISVPTDGAQTTSPDSSSSETWLPQWLFDKFQNFFESGSDLASVESQRNRRTDSIKPLVSESAFSQRSVRSETGFELKAQELLTCATKIGPIPNTQKPLHQRILNTIQNLNPNSETNPIKPGEDSKQISTRIEKKLNMLKMMLKIFNTQCNGYNCNSGCDTSIENQNSVSVFDGLSKQIDAMYNDITDYAEKFYIETTTKRTSTQKDSSSAISTGQQTTEPSTNSNPSTSVPDSTTTTIIPQTTTEKPTTEQESTTKSDSVTPTPPAQTTNANPSTSGQDSTTLLDSTDPSTNSNPSTSVPNSTTLQKTDSFGPVSSDSSSTKTTTEKPTTEQESTTKSDSVTPTPPEPTTNSNPSTSGPDSTTTTIIPETTTDGFKTTGSVTTVKDSVTGTVTTSRNFTTVNSTTGVPVSSTEEVTVENPETTTTTTTESTSTSPTTKETSTITTTESTATSPATITTTTSITTESTATSPATTTTETTTATEATSTTPATTTTTTTTSITTEATATSPATTKTTTSITTEATATSPATTKTTTSITTEATATGPATTKTTTSITTEATATSPATTTTTTTTTEATATSQATKESNTALSEAQKSKDSLSNTSNDKDVILIFFVIILVGLGLGYIYHRFNSRKESIEGPFTDERSNSEKLLDSLPCKNYSITEFNNLKANIDSESITELLNGNDFGPESRTEQNLIDSETLISFKDSILEPFINEVLKGYKVAGSKNITTINSENITRVIRSSALTTASETNGLLFQMIEDIKDTGQKTRAIALASFPKEEDFKDFVQIAIMALLGTVTANTLQQVYSLNNGSDITQFLIITGGYTGYQDSISSILNKIKKNRMTHSTGKNLPGFNEVNETTETYFEELINYLKGEPGTKTHLISNSLQRHEEQAARVANYLSTNVEPIKPNSVKYRNEQGSENEVFSQVVDVVNSQANQLFMNRNAQIRSWVQNVPMHRLGTPVNQVPSRLDLLRTCEKAFDSPNGMRAMEGLALDSPDNNSPAFSPVIDPHTFNKGRQTRSRLNPAANHTNLSRPQSPNSDYAGGNEASIMNTPQDANTANTMVSPNSQHRERLNRHSQKLIVTTPRIMSPLTPNGNGSPRHNGNGSLVKSASATNLSHDGNGFRRTTSKTSFL